MSNLITSFENGNCEVTLWEQDGEFTMDVKQDGATTTIEISERDIVKMIREIANTSMDLAKEIMTGLVEDL